MKAPTGKCTRHFRDIVNKCQALTKAISKNPNSYIQNATRTLLKMIANAVTKPQTLTLKTPREKGDEPDDGVGGGANRQMCYLKDAFINAEP